MLYPGNIVNQLYFNKNLFFGCIVWHAWGPSSPAKHGTHAPAVTAQSPNHRTAREVPKQYFKNNGVTSRTAFQIHKQKNGPVVVLIIELLKNSEVKVICKAALFWIVVLKFVSFQWVVV